MRSWCACPQPRESSNPRKLGSCMMCGRQLDKRWIASDENFREFFDRLEAARPGEDLSAFRADCARREQAGRQTFGFAYLDRDNCVEGFEEAADGGNYAYFEVLRARRIGAEREVVAELLTAASKFAEAHEALARARFKLFDKP